MTRRARVHKKGTVRLAEIIETAKTNEDFHKAGAIAAFIGVVRSETENREKVKKLKLEAYEQKANKVLETICKDLSKKAGIVDVQIHHLLGEFEVGEDLVYVLVAGGHRTKVFHTLEEAVKRFKREAPIFKKEFIATDKGEAKSYWVNERKIPSG